MLIAIQKTPLNPFEQFAEFANNLKLDHQKLLEQNTLLEGNLSNYKQRERALVEENDFLRSQYSTSSSAAYNLSKENNELIESLKLKDEQLNVGLKLREDFQNSVVNQLTGRMNSLYSQRQLELQSDERAIEANIREKASNYTELKFQYDTLRNEYMEYITKSKIEIDNRDARIEDLLQQHSSS